MSKVYLNAPLLHSTIVIQIMIIAFPFLLFSLLFAQEGKKTVLTDEFFEILAKDELENRKVSLKAWDDSELVRILSNITLTDDYVKQLYKEFKAALVNPPNPDTYKEYAIKNGEKSLAEVGQLGRKLHNLLQAISDEDFAKYGTLIGMMRDVLLLDAKHIPLAIKHDNSRDIYWFDLHKNWLEQVEKEYLRVVSN